VVNEDMRAFRRTLTALLRRLLPAPAARDGAAIGPAGAEITPAAASFVDGVDGRRIFIDPRDQRAAALIRAGGDFNPHSTRMWRELVARERWTHVIDVGASYGEMIVRVDFAPGADVVALEPNPYILPYLRRTLGEAGVRVAVLPLAASDRAGKVVMMIDRDWSGMSSLVAGQKQSESHAQEMREVDAVRLDELVRSRGCVPARLLVKIDVEGHEIAVLRGLGSLPKETEAFAALVEVLHLSDSDLDWIVSRFRVELYALHEQRLAAVEVADGAALRSLLREGRYYPQDAVLRLKR
jgi:FkbM family methyltransferase